MLRLPPASVNLGRCLRVNATLRPYEREGGDPMRGRLQRLLVLLLPVAALIGAHARPTDIIWP